MTQFRILVIEDDPEIQELIKQFLLTKNYIVEVALDGVEGMKLFKKQSFDLILLDIMMPNLNGFDTAKMMRQESTVPIIMLTALDEEEDQLKGFDSGIDDYLAKPFSFHVLLKRVEAVLKRCYTQSTQNCLIFHEVALDGDTYVVYVNGQEVPVTTKEFEILQLMMQNEKKVITRENMIEKIWGYDYIGDNRNIDTHIKNLRRKLNVPYIHTIKGVGYKFDE
ncbi:response regulator transcription factor [Bacillus wiedmannii]|uniref:response regulator transcription factor n=1 Tax=Bacillus wiedmannii TaxID=1890302 RepID=UPI000BEF1CA6|nr:response regulator transcription factor [Bacillus wiedmannii]PEO40900.1 DNA-binding response regulator [Bacillus wiedmannii]